MNIIFFGAPGAGKGTQGEIASKALGIPEVSTGNMIREALANQTEIGKKAKEYIENGLLLPDEVVIEIIKERLSEDDCKNGFILDGFPRTIAQAQALEDLGIKIDKVIEIQVDDETILERMTGRRVCSKCGASYHLLYKKPMKENVCDNCGSPLMIRKDDNADTVETRIKVYHEQTEPLKSFYEERGKLYKVKGTQSVEEVSNEVINILKARS
ncbi:MAG: adenylate kinase [Clostridia bacterium]|nr:adenylate kinase [Clostridia bacterium]